MINFTKKGTKTEFNTKDVDLRYEELGALLQSKLGMIEVLRKEIADLDKEMMSLEFIKKETEKMV